MKTKIMKLKIMLLGLILVFSSMTAFAGSGHDHGHSHDPISAETAKINATQIRNLMVEEKVLDISWKPLLASSVQKKMVNGQEEWQVTFVNETVSDPAKKTLFIFLTLSGDYVAANFTGK